MLNDVFVVVVPLLIIAAVLVTFIKLASRHWEVLAGTLVVAVLLAAFVLLPPAMAEETRTVFVDKFDFANSKVVFVDEDGFEWPFPMGKWDATIGDEYTLVITGEDEPFYIEELIGLE